MSKKKLAEFYFLEVKRYAIYGECIMKTRKDSEGQLYPYPEFKDLSATEIANGKEIPYKPDTALFGGNVSIMIGDFILKMMLYNKESYRLWYICPEIKDLITAYRLSVLNIKLETFQKRILSRNMRLYELCLVTDKCTYYVSDGSILAFTTKTRLLLADNYVAEDKFWTSLDNIESGTETLLWKKEAAPKKEMLTADVLMQQILICNRLRHQIMEEVRKSINAKTLNASPVPDSIIDKYFSGMLNDVTSLEYNVQEAIDRIADDIILENDFKAKDDAEWVVTPDPITIIERLKKQLPKGTKIRYYKKKEDRSSNSPITASDISCGAIGSVIQVYDNGSILVNWEYGRKNFIYYGLDLFELA